MAENDDKTLAEILRDTPLSKLLIPSALVIALIGGVVLVLLAN